MSYKIKYVDSKYNFYNQKGGNSLTIFYILGQGNRISLEIKKEKRNENIFMYFKKLLKKDIKNIFNSTKRKPITSEYTFNEVSEHDTLVIIADDTTIVEEPERDRSKSITIHPDISRSYSKKFNFDRNPCSKSTRSIINCLPEPIPINVNSLGFLNKFVNK